MENWGSIGWRGFWLLAGVVAMAVMCFGAEDGRAGEPVLLLTMAPMMAASLVPVAPPDGRIGPLPGRAGTVQADEEGSAAGAVEVARDPVTALAAALGEVAPADVFGARAKRGGDDGGGGRMVVHGGSPSRDGTLDAGRLAPEGEAAERSEGARPGGRLLGTGSKKKGRRTRRRPEVGRKRSGGV